MARIFEGTNNIPMSVKYYRLISQEDASHTEAIASIGLHQFYNDQPEIALRYYRFDNILFFIIFLAIYLFKKTYRRLLQMGVYNAELFTNLGLCCFYSHQLDYTFPCFERALSLATEENIADVWYNISHVAIVSY